MFSNMRSPAGCLALAALFLAAGCRSANYQRRPARVKAGGPVVFIPLRDAENFYFDAEAGVAIARAATHALENNAPRAQTVDFARARGPLRTMILEDNIAVAQWARIAREAGADYLVHGSLDHIAWVDPMDQTVPRCTFTITYAVVRAADPAEIYRATVSGAYPVNVIADRGVTVYEMGREGLRTNAYDYIGTLIARTFYPHTLNIFEVRGLSEGPDMASR